MHKLENNIIPQVLRTMARLDSAMKVLGEISILFFLVFCCFFKFDVRGAALFSDAYARTTAPP